MDMQNKHKGPNSSHRKIIFWMLLISKDRQQQYSLTVRTCQIVQTYLKQLQLKSSLGFEFFCTPQINIFTVILNWWVFISYLRIVQFKPHFPRFTLYPRRVRTVSSPPWRSPTLLFQSAAWPLIDVGSIHVAPNEMEEILQLLTERDIEHTNNLRLRSSSLPVLSHLPDVTRSGWTLSIFLCPSPRSVSSWVCTSRKPSYGRIYLSVCTEAWGFFIKLLTTIEARFWRIKFCLQTASLSR